jgi:hypothetical protein
LIPSGSLLRPAIPGSEIFGESSTYGPRANFKISLRELPDRGEFRVTVRAARYVDCLLLEPGTLPVPLPAAAPSATPAATNPASANTPPTPLTITLERGPDGLWPTLNLPSSGVWQLDVVRGPSDGNEPLLLLLPDGRHCEGRLEKGWTAADKPGPTLAADEQIFALLRTRLAAGPATLQLSGAPRPLFAVYSSLACRTTASKHANTQLLKTAVSGLECTWDCDETAAARLPPLNSLSR